MASKSQPDHQAKQCETMIMKTDSAGSPGKSSNQNIPLAKPTAQTSKTETASRLSSIQEAKNTPSFSQALASGGWQSLLACATGSALLCGIGSALMNEMNEPEDYVTPAIAIPAGFIAGAAGFALGYSIIG